ncbi:MAG TPA: nuclease-related domain-containing protein [Gammaproteobacteria bacterium]|nr:nuclease-related domain-containing protein [Gammaproteobacteria bacterium]
MEFFTTMGPGAIVLFAALGLVLLLVLAWCIWRWAQQPSRALERLLRHHAHDIIADVVIPDGMDGHIHLNYLVLTGDGLWVIDTLNVQGVIFGAPRMDEWAVMQGHSRHSFRNPLYGLQDRVAAVKGLAVNVPVAGKAVFCRGASFPKGIPEGTLEHHAVPELLRKDTVVSDDLLDAWQKIKTAIRA